MINEIAENSKAGVVRVKASIFNNVNLFKVSDFLYFRAMQEEFLHYIWRYKAFEQEALKTTQGEHITLTAVGQYNTNAGPDFFNAQLRIGTQLWAGNLEIHIKSSDWYSHNHEKDKAYDNVILHVVWEHDTEVFRRDNSVIPTLVLQPYISEHILLNYTKLFEAKQQWINCENEFPKLSNFKLQNWLETLYFERLERKSLDVIKLLEASNNDWEAVLFKMLAKNFGLKVNSDAFVSMAEHLNFSILRKVQHNGLQTEALLLGQARLLEQTHEDPYFNSLKTEYDFLKAKFKLNTENGITPLFFRLRPNNFPTIRLSQLAGLYHKHQNLFSKIIAAESLEAVYAVFKVQTSEFWKTHYTFSKTSKATTKALSKAFINLLVINTILPIRFAYGKYRNSMDSDAVLDLITRLPTEKNSIISRFNTLGEVSTNALHSQALLQLKGAYCDTNRCLKCAIGNALIGG